MDFNAVSEFVVCCYSCRDFSGYWCKVL